MPSIMIESGILIVDLVVHRDIISKRYDPIILFIVDRINEKYLLLAKMKIRFPWLFR